METYKTQVDKLLDAVARAEYLEIPEEVVVGKHCVGCGVIVSTVVSRTPICEECVRETIDRR